MDTVFSAFRERRGMLRGLAELLLPQRFFRRECVSDVMGNAHVEILKDHRNGQAPPRDLSFTQYFCKVVRDKVRSVIRRNTAGIRDLDREVSLEALRDADYGSGRFELPVADLRRHGAANPDQNGEIEWVLSRLSDSDREVLQLRALEGWSTEEYARSKNIRVDAARQRLLRALKRARRVMRNRG